MTEADYDEFESTSLIKKAENIQEIFKPLGYKILGFERERNSKFDFSLRFRFVGASVFTGDKSSRPVPFPLPE